MICILIHQKINCAVGVGITGCVIKCRQQVLPLPRQQVRVPVPRRQRQLLVQVQQLLLVRVQQRLDNL